MPVIPLTSLFGLSKASDGLFLARRPLPTFFAKIFVKFKFARKNGFGQVQSEKSRNASFLNWRV